MVNPYLVLGGILYRIIGPPYRLQRSTGADGKWSTVAQRPSSLLILPGDPPDFVTINGDTVVVSAG